jgi:probable F420-dependent oxidoreductase
MSDEDERVGGRPMTAERVVPDAERRPLMEFGVATPRKLRGDGPALLAAARLADDLGYDYLTITEHIIVPVEYVRSPYPYTESGLPYWSHNEPMLEGMVTCGAIAGATKRIRLITMVIPNNTRDPLSLAKQAATVDVLSGGRLTLGLGTGWSLDEAEMLGHPTDHPFGRLSETIEILRKAWTEDSFDHKGRFYEYRELGVHPHPVQGQSLPIWVGGAGERMIRMAAEQADGLLLPPLLAHLAPGIRERLPDHVRMNWHTRYDGDFDKYCETIAELRGAGYELYGGPDMSVDSEPEAWEAELRRFATEVIHRIR